MPTATQTAVMASVARSELQHAMHRLLHRLKTYVRAYPIRRDDALPEHDIVWETEFDDGPGHVVAEAMKATPALWQHAIPEGFCVVQRRLLEQSGLSPEFIDYLSALGAQSILAHADRQRRETEESELRKYRDK